MKKVYYDPQKAYLLLNDYGVFVVKDKEYKFYNSSHENYSIKNIVSKLLKNFDSVVIVFKKENLENGGISEDDLVEWFNGTPLFDYEENEITIDNFEKDYFLDT